MSAVVVFDGVSKKFATGERHDSLRDLFPAIVRSFGRKRPVEQLKEREFWALRDVSFAVEPGEALGIIGPNGAGKSTTLKLLTRILRPTIGSCHVRGRVGALIEVAAGFHPDLTGRENIYLQGAIMGMGRVEIRSKMDDIIEFAGVGHFVDTPIKRYSSGMNARLGFSIAAHLNPDALIIDEVLSVGDMSFQQRCIDRMTEFRAQGVAIVFVSHNLAGVAHLCSSALFLSRGRLVFAGKTAETIERYLEDHLHSDRATSSGQFDRIVLVSENGAPVTKCVPGTRMKITAMLRFEHVAHDVTFGFVVHQASTGIYAYGANSGSLGVAPISVQPGSEVSVTFDFCAALARGLYLIELHAATASTMTIHARSSPAALFRVEEDITAQGVADLSARCELAVRDL